MTSLDHSGMHYIRLHSLQLPTRENVEKTLQLKLEQIVSFSAKEDVNPSMKRKGEHTSENCHLVPSLDMHEVTTISESGHPTLTLPS